MDPGFCSSPVHNGKTRPKNFSPPSTATTAVRRSACCGKYLRDAEGIEPVVLILSAKYGLIAANRKIPNYDCRISSQSARELRSQVQKVARNVLVSRRWLSVGICAGKDYQVALEGLLELIPEGVRVDWIRGGQGPRLTALRDWLNQSP